MTGDEELPRERRLSGWTTRRWLRVGVAGSLAVLAVLGATGAWVLGRTTSLSDTLVNVKSPALSTSFRLESALLNQETGIRGYGLTGTPDFLKPYQQGLADQATYTVTLSRLVGGDDAESADLRSVQDAVEKWQARIARPIAATPAGVASPLASERAAEGKTDFDALRAAMARQQERLRTDQARAREDLAATMRLRNWVFVAIALVIVALAGLIFEAMRRGVTKPLERLGRDARSVTDGDFTRPIVATGPADLRRLSGEIDSMRQRLVRELEVSEQARHHLDTQAAELQRSNAELEQFAYVASHDLQEPLRKVSSFTQLLQRRYAGQLDAKADQYIAFAVDGANRMQTLINDLLDFSRVGRVHHTHESVALDAVVERAVSALAVSIEETGAEISCEELPTLVADPTQMGMLWQNLIGNAVKFHRPGQPPHIHVSAAREGALWRFSVTDDGIGIAPEYAEKVFVIFQRLHTKDAYSGSGIGLAMCKKIVEFHGGAIAVDQEYAGGTRITFTLAEAPPATAEPLPASELPRGDGSLGRGAGERPTAVRPGTEPTP
ncbi:histidine kinase [Streptomyces xanthochromogenes]|uniref:sensor histidine kinase n=1 Tax=Streptomyces xanthochromogenes TaxID=67384 RepID=UPI00167358DE|nr:ATP-binding protein [Streptomyces xanthochromogenes]GHB38873.1 histidine kinase [Streptomyces xanthochromogenes]